MSTPKELTLRPAPDRSFFIQRAGDSLTDRSSSVIAQRRSCHLPSTPCSEGNRPRQTMDTQNTESFSNTDNLLTSVARGIAMLLLDRLIAQGKEIQIEGLGTISKDKGFVPHNTPE